MYAIRDLETEGKHSGFLYIISLFKQPLDHYNADGELKIRIIPPFCKNIRCRMINKCSGKSIIPT